VVDAGPLVSEHGTTRVVRILIVVTGPTIDDPGIVTVIGAAVMMAGFWGTYSAQIPWK